MPVVVDRIQDQTDLTGSPSVGQVIAVTNVSGGSIAYGYANQPAGITASSPLNISGGVLTIAAATNTSAGVMVLPTFASTLAVGNDAGGASITGLNAVNAASLNLSGGATVGGTLSATGNGSYLDYAGNTYLGGTTFFRGADGTYGGTSIGGSTGDLSVGNGATVLNADGSAMFGGHVNANQGLYVGNGFNVGGNVVMGIGPIQTTLSGDGAGNLGVGGEIFAQRFSASATTGELYASVQANPYAAGAHAARFLQTANNTVAVVRIGNAFGCTAPILQLDDLNGVPVCTVAPDGSIDTLGTLSAAGATFSGNVSLGSNNLTANAINLAAGITATSGVFISQAVAFVGFQTGTTGSYSFNNGAYFQGDSLGNVDLKNVSGGAGTLSLGTLNVSGGVTAAGYHAVTTNGIGLLMTGMATDGSSDSNGVVLFVSHNSSGNRQFGFADSVTGSGVRVIGGAIDGFNYLSGGRQPLYLGTDNTGVSVVSTLAVGTNLTAGSGTFSGPVNLSLVNPTSTPGTIDKEVAFNASGGRIIQWNASAGSWAQY